MNNELLNAVANLLIQNGIELKDNAETRQTIISLCVKTLVEAGVAADVAIDVILGAGSYDSLVGSIWSSFQTAKA